MRKKILLYSIFYFSFISCESYKKDIQDNINIDSTLQSKSTSILENNLLELNTLPGQAIK